MRILLTDLAPGVNYALQLRSNTGDAVSEWSRIFYLLTTSDSVAPNTPTGVTGSMSGTSFKLTWNVVTTSADGNPAYDLDHYEVLVSSSGSGNTKVFWTVDTQFEVNLERNIAIFGTAQGNVQMQVRAVDKVGNASAYSSIVSQTNPAPAAPTGLTLSSGVDSINIKWNEVTDLDLKYYEVRISTTGAGGTYNKVYAGTGTSYVHPTINYATDHYVRVYSMDVFNTYSTATQGGPIKPVSAATVDTTAPAIPTGLAATMSVSADASRASAAVSWTAVADPDGDLAGYQIGFRQNGTSDYQYTTVDYLTTATRIDGLVPYVNYDFIIRSFDWAANYSGWSGVATGTGNTNVAPSTPAAPTAASSGQSIQVSHDNTKAGGGAMEGDVIYYEVYASSTTGFTPGTANMLGTMPVGPAIIGQWDVSPSNSSGTTQTWYVKVIAVDKGGLKSTASAQATATPNLILTANIGDLQVTDAKINTLAVNKLTAGTGIINDLTVKAKLTLGDASTVGSIESYGYVAGTTGFHFDKNLLEINQGSIAAAALKIQDSQNLIDGAYAGMEATQAFYDAKTGRDYAFVSVDNTVSRFNKQSLKQIWFTGAAGQRSTVWYGASDVDYNIPVEPSTTYIISAYTRTVTTPAMNYRLKVKESTGTITDVVNVTHDTTGSWMRYNGTITTSATTYQMLIGTSFAADLSDATVWIDGIQVERKQGALSTPSVWKPPGITSIDGGYIRTGEIRSNSTITVDDVAQPAWSIDMEGDAQLGSVLVRGNVIVGLADEPPINRAPWNGDAEANVGTAGYTLYSVGATTPALVRTTTGGEIINGTASYKMTAAAGTKTSLGLYFDTQDFLTGSELTVDFWFKSDAAGDVVVDFHDGTSIVQTNVAQTAATANTLYHSSTKMVVPDAATVRRVYIYQTGSISTTSFILDDIMFTSAKESGQSYIASGNFNKGATGWKVDSAGNAEFNSGIFRGSLGAGTVDAQALVSEMVISNTIKTGNSGRRIEFSQDSLSVFDADESVLVNLPTDPSIPAAFTGDLLATSLTVTDQLAIRGTSNELSKGSQLLLSAGTTAPSSGPQVTIDWPYVSTDIGSSYNAYRYGWNWDGTYFYCAQDIYGINTSIHRYNADGTRDTSWSIVSTINSGGGGAVVLGSDVYVLGLHTDNKWWVERWSISSKTRLARWTWSNVAGQHPAIGTDGTYLIIVSDYYSGHYGKTTWAKYNTAGTYVSGTLVATPDASTSTHYSSIMQTSADFGTTYMVLTTRTSGASFYVYNATTGAAINNVWFKVPTGSIIKGASWDGSNFYSHDASAARNYKHTNIRWTTESDTWYASTTWYDSDATGGTHETTQGPRKKFTMLRRARLTVTGPPLPPRPSPTTTDDVLAGRVFLGRGSSDPGITKMEYQGQYTTGPLALLSVTLPTGSNNATVQPPASNTFPAANPAKIASADLSTFVLNGDGSGNWGPISISAAGVLTIGSSTQVPVAMATGTFASPTVAAGGSTTSTITFPASRFSAAPQVIVLPGSGRLNAYLSSVSASQAVIGWNNWTGASSSGGTVHWIAIEF